MSEIVTKDWTSKRVSAFLITGEKKGIGFKVQINSPKEAQDGLIVYMKEEDYLLALKLFKNA